MKTAEKKLSEIAQELVRLVDAVANYWEVEYPKTHPTYPLVAPGEDPDPPGPPEERQIEELLSSLPADTVRKLALIMEIGSERYGTTDLPAALADVKRRYGKPKETVRRIAHRLDLLLSLRDGLEFLQEANLDVDTMLP